MKFLPHICHLMHQYWNNETKSSITNIDNLMDSYEENLKLLKFDKKHCNSNGKNTYKNKVYEQRQSWILSTGIN